MAETVINFVLEKITTTAVKEVLHLWGVGDQVEKVKRELLWIQAFLKDADSKHIADEIQKQWVRDVRDVGYWIEDVIDTFLCEIPQEKPKSGKREAVKRIFGKAKKLPVIHNLGNEINQILARIEEIKERKDRFGINSLGEGCGRKRLPIRPPILPDIEDPDVIGLDSDKDNIVKQLLDEDTPRRSVVSIVGQGGLGKTTLAKKVYNSNEVGRAFDFQIWVAISQEFELINVLRKIREKLRRIDQSELGKDQEYFLADLFRLLESKKYLLVFDDVWSGDLWMSIEKGLPNKKNGSRILMTTRIHEVAKEADPASEPYKLCFLSDESSLELLLKKAIPNPNREIQNESSHSQLLDLAKQFVKKCGGLPLALVVLGGLLAKKQRTHSAWSKILETMSWHANEQKRCMEIIGTSYDDLPLALKSCFMYFAAFPEDYDIRAESLLRMWVAEGIIPEEENRTLENTAESFLEDLVQRSMVQVSSRLLDKDSILYCRVHDLLRDVAIQKAKEDNFLTVCSTPEGMQRCGQARRIAVHSVDCSEFMKYASPNIRTLLCFNRDIPNCSGHRLLKVLSYEGGLIRRYDGADMAWIEELSQLRYLDAIKCNQWSFDKFIGTAKFLQTLDLYWSDVRELCYPDCMWHTKTLRYVTLPTWPQLPPATDLPNLQNLWYVKSHESWNYTNLPNLPNLRNLAIEITEGSSWEFIVAFLHTLRKLVGLCIKGQDIPIEVVDMKKFPFYQHLTWLMYEGRLSLACNGLDFTMFPTHLTWLQLYKSDLQWDPMPAVERLQGLKQLLLNKAHSNQTMRCSTGGFPLLQNLTIRSLSELEKWEIEEGAMPMLKELDIDNCPKLQVPHGLQHLTSLTKLNWWCDEDDESGPSKAKQIRSICKHVPNITILDQSGRESGHRSTSGVRRPSTTDNMELESSRRQSGRRSMSGITRPPTRDSVEPESSCNQSGRHSVSGVPRPTDLPTYDNHQQEPSQGSTRQGKTKVSSKTLAEMKRWFRWLV